MRGSEKDVNAVAVVRPNPDNVQSKRAVDLHPNILNKEFEAIDHAPKLMATWLTRFLKRQTNCRKVVIKGKQVNRGGQFGLEVPCEHNFLRVTICLVSSCIGRIEEKFDVECSLGL